MKLYKFIAYIPQPYLDQVKNALFEAGAGKLGNYSHCAWQVLGMGQFRPLKGANPAIGKIDQIQCVQEWRVETVVPADRLHDVIHAYKITHPYEMPAFDVYEIINEH